jgi:hypothetical protein
MPQFDETTLIKMMFEDVTLAVNMGAAYCHHKDNFIKAEGRRLASQTMQSIEFKLHPSSPISITNKAIEVTLLSVDRKWLLDIVVYKDSRLSRIVNFTRLEVK